MKKFKNCILIVAIALTLVSCKDESVSQLKKNYSDEEVLQGVLFLKGPFVNEIPELKDMAEITDATLKSKLKHINYTQYRSREDSLYKSILNTAKALDPEFITSFSRDVRSRNPQKVSRAIQGASKLIYSAAMVNHYGEARFKKGKHEDFVEIISRDSSKTKALVRLVKNNESGANEIAAYVEDIVNENAPLTDPETGMNTLAFQNMQESDVQTMRR